jgi:hypothetical protein
MNFPSRLGLSLEWKVGKTPKIPLESLIKVNWEIFSLEVPFSTDLASKANYSFSIKKCFYLFIYLQAQTNLTRKEARAGVSMSP